MRVALLLCLFAASAHAQAFSGVFGGGSSGASATSCTLEDGEPAVATYLRATTLTGPGYACDAQLTSCLDLGPGSRNYLGTNVAGDILLGPNDGGASTTVRIGGRIATAGGEFNGPLDLYNAGYIFSTFTRVKVDDADGFQQVCKTTLTGTCASGLEGTEILICGTGGALTKRCLCMGDGTAYAWRNLLNLAAGAGTTTTCPAT